jgi:F420-dependent methylenetetrahydromethanopterin dehydrogenase
MFDNTIMTMAKTTAPGPASASAAVQSTHPSVVITNKPRRRCERSLLAPMNGIVTITMKCDRLSETVHSNVPKVGLLATTPTK